MKKTILKFLAVIAFIFVQNQGYCAVVPVPPAPSQTEQKPVLTPKPINAQEPKQAQNTTKKEEKNVKKVQQKNITDAKSKKTPSPNKTVTKAAPASKAVLAEQVETDVSKMKPSELNDLREQAKFLYNSNKLDEAQKLYNKIPESDKISDDWLIIANIAQDKGKPIDAVFYLKKAISLDDSNYKAHYNLGNLYFADDKINMALDEYKKTLRIKKDFAYAYYNKGCCYLKKKSWFNARYEFGLAIKANPDEPSFYYNLAYTCKMMKKNKKAQEALEMYNNLMSR